MKRFFYNLFKQYFGFKPGDIIELKTAQGDILIAIIVKVHRGFRSSYIQYEFKALPPYEKVQFTQFGPTTDT